MIGGSAVRSGRQPRKFRGMLGTKMRKVHSLRFICSLAVLVIPLLSFSQAANQYKKEAARAAFLHDLESARQGDLQAKLRVGRAYNEGAVVWRNAHEAVW